MTLSLTSQKPDTFHERWQSSQDKSPRSDGWPLQRESTSLMLSSFWDIGIGWQEWLTHVDTCFEVMGFDLRNELRPAGPFSGIDVGMLGGKHRPVRCAGNVWPKWGGNESATDWCSCPVVALTRPLSVADVSVFRPGPELQPKLQPQSWRRTLGAWVPTQQSGLFFFPNVSRKTWTLRRICSLSFRACTLAFSYARQIRETNTAPNIADVAIRVFNRFESRTSQMWRFLPIPCTPRPREICLHFSRELDRHSREFKEFLRNFQEF
jgi:hypothetical protein